MQKSTGEQRDLLNIVPPQYTRRISSFRQQRAGPSPYSGGLTSLDCAYG
jgi:hypothetical protein